MNHSESIAKLSEAMCAAQQEIDHAHKDSTNPHYKSKFASLPSVIDATVPGRQSLKTTRKALAPR